MLYIASSKGTEITC